MLLARFGPAESQAALDLEPLLLSPSLVLGGFSRED